MMMEVTISEIFSFSLPTAGTMARPPPTAQQMISRIPTPTIHGTLLKMGVLKSTIQATAGAKFTTPSPIRLKRPQP